MTSFFQKLFGNNSENSKHKSNAPQARRLRIESLESRELLAVSPAEFDSIRAMYPELNLSANMEDYNVIEVGGTGTLNNSNFAFSQAGLQGAIDRAAQTTQNDLIVVRTTASQNKIILGGTKLSININTSQFCSVTIVSLGDSPLTVDANQKSPVVSIAEGSTVALAGLTITGGYREWDGSFTSYGGGIANLGGELTVTNSKISGNSAVFGGGIYHQNGTLTVTNSTISENYGGGITLTGLTITGGYADETDYYGGGIFNRGRLLVVNSTVIGNTAYSSGGGIFNVYFGTLTMMDSIITNNSAYYGGGIYNGGELTLTTCTISKNTTVSSGRGGGISNTGELIVTNSKITENSAGTGGGIFNRYDGTLTITDSKISGNLAEQNGGGIFNWNTLTITSSTVTENSAVCGGGIYNDNSNGELTVTNCMISGNTSNASGGGVANFGELTVTNSTIMGNSANEAGGGIANGGTLTVINSIISGNAAEIVGGGILNENPTILTVAKLTMINCTITGNTARALGASALKTSGGIHNGGVLSPATMALYNTIIAQNFGDGDIGDICNCGTAQGSNNLTTFTDWNGGTANLVYDPAKPLFADNYRLVQGSQAIDKGDNAYVPVGLLTDLAGNSRIINGTVDIGAYEYDGIIVVPPVTPTNFRSTSQTTDTVTLVWNAVDNADSYVLEYKKTSDTNWITAPTPTGTTAIITGLSENTAYDFRVQAVNVGGTSDWAMTDATTMVAPPVAPANFTSTAQTTDSITLSWTVQDYLTCYVLEYKKTTDSTWTEWTPAPGVAATNATITGLAANTAYDFQLTAINASGSASSEATATTAPVEPENPLVITTLDDGGASLYNAISNAKDGDTIIFDTGLSGTITLSGGELIIDKSIKIDANGADITIDADGQSRVINVAAGTTVTLVGLTITGGLTDKNGGGILNAGMLTMIDCTITGNEAKRGGGIASTGTTIIYGGTIADNISHSYGGGVYVQSGTTTIEDCVITGNKMEPVKLSGGAVLGGSGGGIYNAGTLFVTGGEITNNKAPQFAGGGVSNEGKATIEDCLIADNSAEWAGGVSNSNYGKMEITNSRIENNTSKQGYGGVGNAGTLDLYDTIVTENTAKKLGGGLGNNTGRVTLHGTTEITDNISSDEYKDIWTKPEDAVIYHNTIVAPASFGAVPVAPVYEISTPTEGELVAKTLTYWEFSAAAISSSPIKDWEINWGDGSENTLVLGGPRSRINVTHYFCEAGTYSVTIKTTDFDGVVNTITIGTYTVKERMSEPLAVVAPSGPETDVLEFSLQEPVVVASAAPMQFTSESRFDYLSDLMEIMRQRQMLDLDQSGQKSEGVPFAEVVWSDDDLFDEWTGLSEQPEEGDFWSEVFENDLLALK